MPTALLFTYRSFPGLAAAAKGLGLPDVLLDVPHWGFTKQGDFAVQGGPAGHLPGVLDQHSSMAFALDRWLVLNYILPTPLGGLLRPNTGDTFNHGFDEMATVAQIRTELEAAGFTVIDWATARTVMQPRRPESHSAALLAAARAVAAAPVPAAMRVPDLPPKVDLNGPDDDEAIRVLARAGQLWRMQWFWNTVFDGDPDDAFRVEALAREGGASDHDWARFVALAPRDHMHVPLSLWLLAHAPDLDIWLGSACAGHAADLPWLAAKLRERLSDSGPCIDPLGALRKRCIDKLVKLARRAKDPPPVDAEVAAGAPEPLLVTEDPSFAQRRLLLLLATPGHEMAARAQLAQALPSIRGGAMAGLIAVARLAIDDPVYPVHAPDLAGGLVMLGWSVPADASLHDVQRQIRGRAAEFDAAIAATVAADLQALQAGVFGTPRFDPQLPEAPAGRPRDVPAMLGLLLRGELEAGERRPLGTLRVTSGRVTATDPLTSLGRAAFTRELPPGDYPVTIAIDEDDDVGALIVRLDGSDAPVAVARWEAAVRIDEDPAQLEPGQVFGYPVDGGIAGIMDAEAAAALDELEDAYEELIEPALDEDPAVMLEIPGAAANAAISRSGEGDGFYSTWWGLDAEDRPVALVADFAGFSAPAPEGQRERDTLIALDPWISRARRVLDEAFGPRGFSKKADEAAAQIDFDCEEVTVAAYRGALRVQISARFESYHDRLAPGANSTLLAFVGEDEAPPTLPAPELPGFGQGLYASLATIDAQLQGGGVDAFLAEVE